MKKSWELKVTDKKGIVNVIRHNDLSKHKDAVSVEDVDATETTLSMVDECNQNCIFCLRGSSYNKASDEKIIKSILSQKNTVSFEGGEPTLRKDLIKWIQFAKENGTKEIILVTNGVMLCYKDYAKKLIDAGITLFNINFPSHIESLSDELTQTKGNLQKRIKGVKNLISLGAGKKTKLTFVINSLNYKTMPDFVKFVKKEFPEIFYIEFNLIKVLGYVKERKYLIPSLNDIKPYLHDAMEYSSKNNIKILVDGIPLCCMEGFEQNSIDVFKLTNKEYTFLSEKERCPECIKCSLNNICVGPLEDYPDVCNSLKASSKNPEEIISKIK